MRSILQRWAGLGVVLFAVVCPAADLSKIERTIAKEPQYKSAPKYCLLVFGAEAKKRVWMVLDGETLYVDRNGNGDLTEAGEAVAARNDKNTAAEGGVFLFEPGEIQDGKLVHKGLRCAVGKFEEPLSLDPDVQALLKKSPEARRYLITCQVEMPGRRGAGLGGRVEQAASYRDPQGILQFAEKPADAPLIHFGGPFTIDFYGERQKLVIGRRTQLVLSVGTPGQGPGSTAIVAYDGLIASSLRPQAEIRYRTGSSGSNDSLPHIQHFKDRCCTFNFLAEVEVPENVAPGQAELALTFKEWNEGQVAGTKRAFDIVAPKSANEPEQVSRRLKGKLFHPHNRSRERLSNSLVGIQFSPDGKQIVGGDYPGGVVQLWQTSGTPLRTIETGKGYRSGWEYFFLTPDWKSVYVAHGQRKHRKIERDGKQMLHWEFDHTVKGWDLNTGKLKATFQSNPARCISSMNMSADGSTLLLDELLPGESEGHPARATSLLDLKSGKFRPLDGKLGPLGKFSPDGRSVAIPVTDDQNFVSAVQMINVVDGKVVRSLPVQEKLATCGWTTFSPDGKMYVLELRVLPKPGAYREASSLLKVWDTSSGELLATITPKPAVPAFVSLQFSPNGRILATTVGQGTQSRLYLCDLERRRFVHTVVLAESAVAQAVAFSPDSRLVAVTTQVFNKQQLYSHSLTVDDLPQPRIHLVEAATGKIVETIISPPGAATSACFSPDGKTLATAGSGCVLLWDVADR